MYADRETGGFAKRDVKHNAKQTSGDAAKISVHIAYGFMNVRKLDLEVSTNADGKARFTGLPDRLKHGLYFRASEGDRSGEAFDDPANTCKAQFTIALRKK